MSVKNSLTNEELSDRFDNAFALVNYAINMARNLVLRGEEFPSNPANDVLERIVDHRDHELLDDEDVQERVEEDDEIMIEAK